MKKSAITEMPEYFDRYIKLVEDIDVVEALEKYGINYLRINMKLRLEEYMKILIFMRLDVLMTIQEKN